MAVLTRDAILNIADIKTELVPVPEWGGDVMVKGMNGAERDKFEASIVQQHGKEQNVNMANVRAKLASFCICDEAGKRLFTEKDIDRLAQKSAAALQRVFKVAQNLSGIGDEAVEELAAGLKNTQGDDSTSD